MLYVHFMSRPLRNDHYECEAIRGSASSIYLCLRFVKCYDQTGNAGLASYVWPFLLAFYCSQLPQLALVFAQLLL
jgi:hypothetical protein